MSDRESRGFGMVHQASVESTDSRLCYLTSSEVSDFKCRRRHYIKSISTQKYWQMCALFRFSDLVLVVCVWWQDKFRQVEVKRINFPRKNELFCASLESKRVDTFLVWCRVVFEWFITLCEVRWGGRLVSGGFWIWIKLKSFCFMHHRR